MSTPAWKAGDTCTIKPETASVPAYQCGALWTVAHVKPNGEVGVHNGVPGNTEFFAMTIFTTLDPSRLLPAGDARPMVAAEMGAEVLRLRARVAELEAAQRWRVTAEVSPHEGDRVLGLRGGDPEVMTYAEEGLDHPYLWFTANDSGVDAPEYWMPIPAAPVALSQGADVPEDQP